MLHALGDERENQGQEMNNLNNSTKGKRPRGRPARRWRDELDDYWQRIAQDRHIWNQHADAFDQIETLSGRIIDAFLCVINLWWRLTLLSIFQILSSLMCLMLVLFMLF